MVYMKQLKHLIITLSILFFWYSSTFAIVLQVPPVQWQEDVVETWPSQVETDESTIFEIIQIVNKYLWFAIWAVAMVIFVVAWFKLISAWWDAAAVWKANKMLIWSMIALLVSILSYALVRIIVNLF